MSGVLSSARRPERQPSLLGARLTGAKEVKRTVAELAVKSKNCASPLRIRQSISVKSKLNLVQHKRLVKARRTKESGGQS